jgi:lysozyme
MSRARIAIGLLTLSAAGFVGILQREGYTDVAIIPTKGDRPTNGFGSTFKEDGSPVRMGDRTTPVKAAQRSLVHIQKDEGALKQCVGPDVPLSQAEYDIYVNLAYNIGTFNFCTGGKAGQTSTIVKRLRAFDYAGACASILDWKKAGGFDCSTPGNQICAGVWTDRLNAHAACMAAQ